VHHDCANPQIVDIDCKLNTSGKELITKYKKEVSIMFPES
jgi:hypothetical protein